ncbi:MAG: hypothetical protein AAGK97_17630 [Bacteroidota bacterium]
MKLSSADKAMLITFSGASLLVLVFFFLGVKPYENPNPEEEFIEIPVVQELEEEELEEKREPIATNQLKSHQAFNTSKLQQESKQLFEEEDQIRKAIEAQQSKSVQDLMDETDNALASEKQKRLEELEKRKKEIAQEITAREKAREQRYQDAKRESTVSYHLPDRTAIRLPNPVYTCDAVGKIVLNISVDNKGVITEMNYNQKASTSSNGCLIDQAMTYANDALFSGASKAKQLGSITFYFQG